MPVGSRRCLVSFMRRWMSSGEISVRSGSFLAFFSSLKLDLTPACLRILFLFFFFLSSALALSCFFEDSLVFSFSTGNSILPIIFGPWIFSTRVSMNSTFLSGSLAGVGSTTGSGSGAGFGSGSVTSFTSLVVFFFFFSSTSKSALSMTFGCSSFSTTVGMCSGTFLGSGSGAGAGVGAGSSTGVSTGCCLLFFFGDSSSKLILPNTFGVGTSVSIC